MTDADEMLKLQQRCTAAVMNPTFELFDMLAWSDESRSVFIAFIAALGRPYAIKVGRGAVFDNLFSAVLHVAEGPDNVDRCERSKRALLEAAAFLHPNAKEAACAQIAKRLRELGLRGVLPQSLVKMVKKIRGEQAARNGVNPTTAAIDFLKHLRKLADAGDQTRGQCAAPEEPDADAAPVLRFFHDELYEWAGPGWRPVSMNAFKPRVVQYLQSDDRYESVTDRFARDVLVNVQGLTLVPDRAQQLPLWIPSDEPFECQPSPYVVLRNGMLNWRQFLDGRRPADCFVPVDRRNFATAVLPYAFNPDATCPLWLATLREIFPRTHDQDCRIEVLQEFFGWTLSAREMRLEKFLVLFGKGANGKSTVCTIWTAMLGEENVSHVPLDQFGSEFRLYQMANKFANIAADMSRVDKVAEGVLKIMTSGDPFQANRKFLSPITMWPVA